MVMLFSLKIKKYTYTNWYMYFGVADVVKGQALHDLFHVNAK